MTLEEFKNTKFKNYDIDFFIKKIKNKEYFSYSRFNDGELICSIKYFEKETSLPTENCDKHEYFPKMGEELIITLNKSNCENYFIQYLGGWINNNDYKNYTEKFILNKKLEGVYLYSDFLRESLYNNPNSLKKLINVLNETNLVIVGPAYLKEIKFLKYNYFIEVPLKNCYLNKDILINNIKNFINKEENFTILFSSSMATNVIIDELYKNYKDKGFLIDCGSLWDIFFIDTNKDIKQRSGGLRRANELKKQYNDYFII